MLHYVINELVDRSINYIVCERGIDISGIDIHCEHIIYITDVRSATFYSLGLAQKTQEPVILLIREEYIANVFTGLTEGWFQQREIYVIAVGKDILNKDISYLKPCTRAIIKIQAEIDFDNSMAALPVRRVPTVFLVEETLPTNGIRNKTDITALVRNFAQDDKILAYEPVCTSTIDHNIEYISSDDKYGILSKYMGIIIGTNANYYLVTSSESIDLDMNIFNNRYMCPRFKVIIIGKIEKSKQQWIEKNGIYLFSNNVLSDEACREFIKIEKPTIWNIE